MPKLSLEQMKIILTQIGIWLGWYGRKQVSPQIIEVEPELPVIAPVEQSEPVSPIPKYLFDTPQNSRHSVRVICDEVGLTPYQKNVVCACIDVESQFYNYLPSGNPTTHKNYAKDTKTLLSTDWGIVQVNDYWNIGRTRPFPSVDFVMKNPDRAVRWMAGIMKATNALAPWVSYTSGEYLKHMPQ